MSLSANKDCRFAGPTDAQTFTPPNRGLTTKVLDYFGVASKGSSLPTEILAGASTFLALSYIFVVNPAILAQVGMNKSAVLFATIATSGLATLAMGLWARLPFVLAPGMEMNAYVAFFVVGTLGFTWQQALGAVFWSGVLFVLLTVTRVREKIIDSIPERMKSGLSLSVGVFLGLVACKISGLLRYDGVRLVGFGDFTTPQALALYVSLGLVLLLDRLRVRGAVMISIVVTAALCPAIGIGRDAGGTAQLSGLMLSGIGRLDLAALLQPRMLSVILILFLIDFYGSIAKLIGLTLNTNIVLDGKLPRIREALMIDGLATTTGALLGTSSLTVYVESGVGIGAGGRTGICAVVCSILMLACFALAPFLQFVPVAATTGTLIWVALKLCPARQALRTSTFVDLLALSLMQLVVVATFALDKAMLTGFVIYLGGDLAAKRKINVFLAASAFMLGLGVLLQVVK